MTAHIYAALMAEYAKDAAETDKPWVWWEWKLGGGATWQQCVESPNWHSTHEYRRKRTPLCQVEGKDVFPGDKLWSAAYCSWVTAKEPLAKNYIVLEEGGSTWIDSLSWTEPQKTKTVYQWAVKNKFGWFVPDYMFEDEDHLKRDVTGFIDARRLDYTALEVPA